jgi:hypothetical protein
VTTRPTSSRRCDQEILVEELWCKGADAECQTKFVSTNQQEDYVSVALNRGGNRPPASFRRWFAAVAHGRPHGCHSREYARTRVGRIPSKRTRCGTSRKRQLQLGDLPRQKLRQFRILNCNWNVAVSVKTERLHGPYSRERYSLAELPGSIGSDGERLVSS